MPVDKPDLAATGYKAFFRNAARAALVLATASRVSEGYAESSTGI